MDPDVRSEDKRILLVAPTARDGEITRSLLAKAGLMCVVCENLNHLVKELHVGAGAVLLTEEAITREGIDELLTTVDKQPSWSDLPVVMMMRQGDQSPVATGVLRLLRNVTLLERPAPTLSVVSAVQAAVRGRERQYQMRDQFESIREGEVRSRELQEQLEIAVDASELGTFHCDMPLDKIVWNARCKAHFWLRQDAEIDFDLFYSILHPDDRERTREAIAACVYGGKVYDIEYRTVSPQGEVRWVRATGRTYYKEEKPVRFDGTTQDITDRKRVDCVTLDLSGKVKFWLRAARCQESRGRIQWLDHLHPRQLSTFWLSQVGWSQKTDKLREAAQSRRKSSDERRRVPGLMRDPRRRIGKLKAKLTFATTRRRLSSWHSA